MGKSRFGSGFASGIDCPVSLSKPPVWGLLGTSLPAETTLWNRCIRDLQAELPEQQFNTWIRPLQAVEDDGRLRLLAPNRFVVDWLQEHYIQRILEIIDGAGSNTELVVEVGSRPGASPADERPSRLMSRSAPAEQ